MASRVCWHLATFSMIDSTVVVHAKGFGSSFQAPRKVSMAAFRSGPAASQRPRIAWSCRCACSRGSTCRRGPSSWAGERLYLALLIHAQHDRVVRGVNLQTHRVGHLLQELGVPGELEGLLEVGLKVVSMPDVMHRGFADPLLARQDASALAWPATRATALSNPKCAHGNADVSQRMARQELRQTSSCRSALSAYNLRLSDTIAR